MIEVTKEEFFAVVGPLDIRLRSERNETIWETSARVVVGKSVPGYVATYPLRKTWYLTESFCKPKRASSEGV